MCAFFFFKKKTAHERRISDWSSVVCSSDLFAGKARVAVVNADDAESAPLLSAGNVVTFGFGDAATVRGSDFEALPDGCRFAVHADGTAYQVKLRMPGRHNAANALAAIAEIGRAHV